FALGDRFNREREARLEEQRARIEALRQSELAEERMLDSLSHHGLTGLPNRAMLESRLNEELARVAGAGQGGLALLLLHFRSFDDFNKTLGHENADQVLCQLSARLNELALTLPDRVMIEETGGRRFAVAHVEGITFACALRVKTRAGMIGQINRLVSSLREPVAFRGLNLDIGMVGGCALYPDDSHDVTSLLRHAFIAFDQAGSEANHVGFYSPEINPYSERRLTLMTALRSAINNNQLTLYYQPQVAVNPWSVCGFEVLLRWEHADYGFIPPDEFIPMAEHTGLMGLVTDWVLENALDFARSLREAGSPVSISVNISALNLQQGDFAEDVVAKVTQLGMSPSDLTLEVTETATMVDPKAALVVLRKLARAGIRLAIDDFGTGYSSLSYIRQLPVHEIKIDRSFVMDMDGNGGDATIVRTTINMCHDLGFIVVAEGVETASAQSLLQAMGCNRLQGYHLGRPMPGDQVIDWLASFSLSQGTAGSE
ncbi:MAG: GGDEF domain-containing phosphodiesterase, partial [Oleiphilaceae bacterium]|nr:GGDEF domain-containing phosphodiesterase [Oleiphilaceae bacterium]